MWLGSAEGGASLVSLAHTRHTAAAARALALHTSPAISSLGMGTAISPSLMLSEAVLLEGDCLIFFLAGGGLSFQVRMALEVGGLRWVMDVDVGCQ